MKIIFVETIEKVKEYLQPSTGFFLVILSTDSSAYMGNFSFSLLDSVIVGLVLLLASSIIGFIPVYLVYRRYKKRWLFWLTPVIGFILLYILLSVISMFGVII